MPDAQVKVKEKKTRETFFEDAIQRKAHDINLKINTCEACFAKQRGLDRLKEEIQSLRLKVSVNRANNSVFCRRSKSAKSVSVLDKSNHDKNQNIAEELFGKSES